MQYCYMPAGDWQTDATPAAYKPKDAVSFHILAGGSCWLDFDGQRTTLHEGDIAAFPFGTPHRIGAGEGGPDIDPNGHCSPHRGRKPRSCALAEANGWCGSCAAMSAARR